MCERSAGGWGSSVGYWHGDNEMCCDVMLSLRIHLDKRISECTYPIAKRRKRECDLFVLGIME